MTDEDELLQESSDNMLRQPSDVYSPPDETFRGSGFTSRRSVKTTASENDKDDRHSLGHRNIYIQRQDPPLELMRRVERIISQSRASPEMDDFVAKELRDTIRRSAEADEDRIIRELAPHIVPAINEIPSQRLEQKSDQLWSDCVSVPLDPVVLKIPLPLPKSKPDLAFGYSEAAFNRKQLSTIDLLIDDQYGRSYAVPGQNLRFPFLNIEFKSPAQNGSLYQVAGAGAIALNGNLELISRSFGVENFDFDEPQFFSVLVDDRFACVNVHWIRDKAEGGQYSFHLEELSAHILKDANSVRALQRAIKNILDRGSNTRLPRIRDALEVYRRNFIAEREAVTAMVTRRDVIQTQLSYPCLTPSVENSFPGKASSKEDNHAWEAKIDSEMWVSTGACIAR